MIHGIGPPPSSPRPFFRSRHQHLDFMSIGKTCCIASNSRLTFHKSLRRATSFPEHAMYYYTTSAVPLTIHFFASPQLVKACSVQSMAPSDRQPHCSLETAQNGICRNYAVPWRTSLRSIGRHLGFEFTFDAVAHLSLSAFRPERSYWRRWLPPQILHIGGQWGPPWHGETSSRIDTFGFAAHLHSAPRGS